MKVSVACVGRHHAFDLAEQLRQRGLLHKLYTAYPLWKVPVLLKPYTKTFPYLMSGYMLAGRYSQEWLQERLAWPVAHSFDRWLCREVQKSPPDILHVWAQHGAETTEICKRLVITTVCDRGSTHILHQSKVLEAEYRHYGLELPSMNQRLLDAELRQYQAATAIAVPSRVAHESFRKYDLQPFVVPYGVDLNRFRWRKARPTTFRVLFVGTLSIRKGIPLLISALKHWHPKNAEIWLVGTVLKEVAPWLKNLPSHIHVKGPVPQADLPELFASSSVLLLPSVEEGLALVIGQALACGLPVVATKETGADDIMTTGQHGVILSNRTPSAIVEAIDWLYRSPQTLNTRRENIRALRPQLGWDRYGQNMVEQYEKL